MHSFRATLPCLLLLLLGACSRSDEDSPGAHPGPSQASDAGPAGSAQKPPTAPPAAPIKPAATEAGPPPTVQEQLQAKYSSLKTLSPPKDCKANGYLLSVAWPSQPSRWVWLKELLKAEPLVAQILEESESVQAVEYLYGARNYGRSTNTSDISRWGIALRCRDTATCTVIAALYDAIDPFSPLKHFCGAMPSNTGGPVPLKLDRVLSGSIGYPHGSCARFRACSLEAGLEVSSCDGLPPTTRSCAELPVCEESLRCFEDAPRDPKRKLWKDSPTRGRNPARHGAPPGVDL